MPNTGNPMLTVAHLSARPGERVEGYVALGERRDHQPFQLPITIVNGVEGGPVAYLQAVSDGDELNGSAVMLRILRRLRPETLRGAVIACPLVNDHAFLAGQTASPVDGKKMNRCFPGNPKGTSSERIAHFLFHEAVLQVDFAIDLHQGGTFPMVDECRVRVNLGDRAGRRHIMAFRATSRGRDRPARRPTRRPAVVRVSRTRDHRSEGFISNAIPAPRSVSPSPPCPHDFCCPRAPHAPYWSHIGTTHG